MGLLQKGQGYVSSQTQIPLQIQKGVDSHEQYQLQSSKDISNTKTTQKDSSLDYEIFKQLLLLLETFFVHYSEEIWNLIYRILPKQKDIIINSNQSSIEIKLIIVKIIISLLRSNSCQNPEGQNAIDNDSFTNLDEDIPSQIIKNSSKNSGGFITIGFVDFSGNSNSIRNDLDETKNMGINDTVIADLLKKSLDRILSVKELVFDDNLEKFVMLIQSIPRNNTYFFDKQDYEKNQNFTKINQRIVPLIKHNKTKLKQLEYILIDDDIDEIAYKAFFQEFLEIGQIKNIENDFFYSLASILNNNDQKISQIDIQILVLIIKKSIECIAHKNKRIVCNSIRILGLMLTKIMTNKLYDVIAEYQQQQNPNQEDDSTNSDLKVKGFFDDIFVKEFKNFLLHSFAKFAWNATFSLNSILTCLNLKQAEIFEQDPKRQFLLKQFELVGKELLPVVIDNLFNNNNIKLKLHSAKILVIFCYF